MNLEAIVWRDEETSTNTANVVGTVKELFADCEFLPVTKNLDKRITLMFRKGKKISNVVGSTKVTELYRAGKVSLAQILGFPVIKAENGGLFAGLPSTGWMVMADITVEDYKISTVHQLEALS